MVEEANRVIEVRNILFVISKLLSSIVLQLFLLLFD